MGIFKNSSPALRWIAFVVGVFLITTGVITAFSLAGKAGWDGGKVDFRKVTVNEKEHQGNSAMDSFSNFQMDTVRTRLGNVPVAFVARPQSRTTSVEAVKNTCAAAIIGVDSYYADFHNIDMVEGSFLTAQDEKTGSDVVVIEDSIAWELYKTNNVVGMSLHIFDRDFTITGVFKKDGSIIGRLTDDGIPEIFMLTDRLTAVDSSAGVTGFEAGTPGDERLDKYKEEVVAAIQAAGKNPSDFNLTDYNIEGAILGEKPLLVAFLFGLICTVSILAVAWKAVKTVVAVFRQGLKMDYFTAVLKEHAGVMVFELARVTAAIVTVAVLWNLMSFKLYIPPTMIPDQLIDLAYYSNLIKSAINNAMVSLGYVPSYTEIGFHTADSLVMWILCITVPIGLLLFFTGLAGLSGRQNTGRRAIAGVTILLCSIILQLPVCALLGITPVIGLQQLLIIGLFVFFFSVRDVLT